LAINAAAQEHTLRGKYQKEIELEVTLYFDDPENLEVRKLE